MSLRTVTLIAAITQLLALVLQATNFTLVCQDVDSWPVRQMIAISGWGLHIVANATLIVFLFYLVARQNTQGSCHAQ